MLTLYIAGPMTGLPEYNYPAFFDAERQLRAAGYLVMNPADRPDPTPRRKGDTAPSWGDWLRGAIGLLVQCDGVALLPGWEASKGALFEIDIANRLGMDVRSVSVWLEGPA